ncbi:unnamed protein product [Durusdinium trenchii]|uniref:Poly [ADP-ribose] polymerase n=1 Tax=Durusdinium trenchii TaxID=1381693 RepID=A0ABP0RYI8_9DINO
MTCRKRKGSCSKSRQLWRGNVIPYQNSLLNSKRKKRQLQQRLESNDVDTQRLREELKRREAESLRLRSETKHLEQRIHEEKAARVAEKAELVRQLRSQPPASVDEETWQYQNDEGDWVSYSSRSNDELMGALKEGKKTIILTIDQKGYEVDFTLMKQMNQRTEKRRSIRLFFGLPNHWGMTDEDALKLLKGEVQDAQEASDASVSMGTVLTTISEGTRMAMRAPFKKFVRKVQDLNWLSELESLLNSSALRHDQSRCHCPHGDSKYRLLEAYQVRNLYLWRRYQRFVRNLGDKQNQHGIVPEEIQPPVCEALTNFAEGLQVDLPCNERLLFHGTMKFGYAKAIAVEGFDNRIARQGLYGKGTYFASQTCKSAQYATKRGRAEKASHRMPGTMLVARVALGDPYYTEGKYNESRPPTKNSHPVDDSDDERTVLCDSLIARPGIQAGQHPQAHMEFVTFAPEQAYPEFILRFVEED